MPQTPLAVGQNVTIDDDRFPGQVYRVDRIKVTKALIQPVNAAARNRYPGGVNVPMSMLVPFDGDPDAAVATTRRLDPDTLLADLERKMRFEQGVLVRIDKAYDTYTPADLFVVTANNDKTVSIVKVGGDGGRYLRWPHSGLTIVDPAEILVAT